MQIYNIYFNCFFDICVEFLELLGSITHLTYKEISVIVNLWLQGGILVVSSLFPLWKILNNKNALQHKTLSAIITVNALVSITVYINAMVFYHLPFDGAFDLCVNDLISLSDSWQISYQMVNLLIFVAVFILWLSLNIGLYLMVCKVNRD